MAATKLLIVIDMQNDFIDGALGTKEAEAIVPAVLAKIATYPPENIIATMDTHTEDYLSTQEGKYLPVLHCIRDTKGWELHPKIAEKLAGAKIYEKPTFGSVDLAKDLKARSETEDLEIEVIGLCTDICVVSNALLLKAAMPEVPIRVDPACCAGVTPDSHTAALETMKMCQIGVRTGFLYFETGSTDPYYNLAFEDYIFENYRTGDILILWQNDNTVVIGKNQITDQQINREFIEEHHVNVVRRMTGGGAVYHDLGNINYSFITDHEDESVTASLEVLARPIVEALKGLGLDAEVSGRNDILISGAKVSGTAQRVGNNRILHHGTLLFKSNKEMVAGALKVDQEKFRGKGIRSVQSRIGNIADFLGAAGNAGASSKDLPAGDAAEVKDMPSFFAYLRKTLLEEGQEPVALPPEELAAVRELADTKYRTWEWNYGYSPRFEISNKKYLDGGCLECMVKVEGSKISAIRFFGDFLATRPLDEVEDALKDVHYDKASVGEVLDRLPLGTYFGGISKEGILSTVFSEN